MDCGSSSAASHKQRLDGRVQLSETLGGTQTSVAQRWCEESNSGSPCFRSGTTEMER